MSSRGSGGMGGQESRVISFGDRIHLTPSAQPISPPTKAKSTAYCLWSGTFFLSLTGEFPVDPQVILFLRKVYCLSVHSGLQASY